ncbi:MAG TPA: PhnD/SsuA/transferrin family substrate-binding protein [Candidatus Limnocylindria bacterium]|nr:PhnD/SsuA/transferrin family substrate-binding protein [Candidatus Limnocylindria bacterium]
MARLGRALAILALLLAGCSPQAQAPAATSAASGPTKTTPTQLKFNANGTPDLTGVSLSLGNSAGDATIGDTVVYIVSKTLEQWGATVNFQLGQGNTTELAVVSGQLNATAGPMPSMLNAGLSIFGNSQVHVDYLLVAKSFNALDQIKGKKVAIATTVSPDNLLLDGALKKAGLARSDVTIALTGSNGASVNQMLQGQVDAAFVHADGLLKLQKTGTFNVLANSNDLTPWFADSYIGAMPAWLAANPAYAEAIDLAWLHAAKVFDTDKAQWSKYAVEFTKGTVTDADAAASYDALAKGGPWPADGSGLEPDTLQKNFDVNKQNGQLKGAGDRPMAQWFVAKPWTDAVAYFKAHSSAF